MKIQSNERTTNYVNNQYKPDPAGWNDLIDLADFDTESPNPDRISKQIDTYQKEQFMKKYGAMSLEELKEMRLVSNTEGRPSPTLTDKKWQTEFSLRRMFVQPVKADRLGGKFSKEYALRSEEAKENYSGTTNWQTYCGYINDILRNIRMGQIDYCYYIYQILDLLKFHHDDLRTRYVDGYWEVWLEKKGIWE